MPLLTMTIETSEDTPICLSKDEIAHLILLAYQTHDGAMGRACWADDNGKGQWMPIGWHLGNGHTYARLCRKSWAERTTFKNREERKGYRLSKAGKRFLRCLRLEDFIADVEEARGVAFTTDTGRIFLTYVRGNLSPAGL